MFNLRIDTRSGNNDNCKKEQVLKCLQKVIEDISIGKIEGIIKDENGNMVGRFNLEE
jgi:hypothetical protein